MHVNCPHCQFGIEVVAEVSLADVQCSSCGSHFSLLGDDPDQTLPEGRSTKSIGRFELVNEVGKGAFGSVWKGRDPDLDRIVAVKVPRKGQLNKEESEQFFREARAAAQLKHPNIVPVHEIGIDNETIYIISDFVQGVSLADRLTAGPLEIRESAELCLKVAHALQHAHEKGVIHRDLKPANIMLDANNEPFVMDFGLAKREAGEITMTVDGQILGTPAFMSPEQAQGSAHDADGRSDVYSLGVILFKLVTGELPFRGNMQMLIHQVISEEAPSPLKLNANIDHDVATITSKCLEKDPERRYQSATELAGDLECYLQGRPISARPIGRLERGWRWCKRKPALSGTIALSVILLTALAIGGPLFAIQQARLKQEAQAATQQALDEKNRANLEAENARLAENRANESAKRSADVLLLLTNSFRTTDPTQGSDASMSAKDVIFQARDSIDESELDELGKAMVLESLASAFWGTGEFDASISAAEKTLEIYKSKFGENDVNTLGAMHQLALGYYSNERYQEAVDLYEKVAKERTRQLGDDHPDSLNTKNNLALTYSSLGEAKKAFKLNEETIAIRAKVLGDDHPDTLRTKNNQALILQSQNKFEEALAIREQVFALMKEKLGEDHPDTLNATQNLAASYISAGRFNDALELRKQTVELRRTKLGEDHPDTLLALTQLATCYELVGQKEKALELNEQTIAMKQKRFGKEHPDTLRSMVNLAGSYFSAGQYKQALDLNEETYELMKMNLGEEHLDTLQCMTNLANSFYMLDRFAESLKIRERIIEVQNKRLVKDHPDILVSQMNVALSYNSVGRVTLALKLNEQTLQKMIAVMGEHHPTTVQIMFNLADCYDFAGRRDASITLRKSALAIRRKELGESHVESVYAMYNVANAFAARDRYDESLRLRESVLEIRKSSLGENHPFTFWSSNNLSLVLQDADIYASQSFENGDVETAEQIWLAMQNHHGTFSNLVKDVPKNLHVLYLQQKEYTKSLESIDRWRKNLNPDNRADKKQIAWAITSQSACYAGLGDWQQAESAAQKALAMKEITSSNRHRCNSVLAVCAAQKKEFEAAKELAITAFEGLEKKLDSSPANLRWYVPRACERVVEVHRLAQEDELVATWQKKLDDINEDLQKKTQIQFSFDNATFYNDNVWAKVVKMATTFEVLTEQDIKNLRIACQQYPRGALLNTLGVAEFRMGNFQAAIEAAERSLKLLPDEMGLPASPSDLAILAMSHHQLGDLEAANQYRTQLLEAMKLDAFTSDNESKLFAAETECYFDVYQRH